MDNFRQCVLNFIKKVPKGRVVSYGQVAAFCGNPRAARQVGWILHSLPANTDVPWWRVINNGGYLSIKGNWENTKEIQTALLRKEGVKVEEDFTLDMKKYRFKSPHRQTDGFLVY